MLRKKEFITLTLNLNNEIFVVYIAFLTSSDQAIDVYPYCRVQIVSLIVDKAFIIILFKYTEFANIFSLDFVTKFLKHTRINNHAIDLIRS